VYHSAGSPQERGTQGVSHQIAPPRLAIESITGRDSFAFYCSSCHGTDGKGNGPTALALKTSPPDLTALARRAGGSFPRAQVEAFINGTGRAIPAHGSGNMPVWGPIFKALDPADPRARVRIENLVGYLESIQVR
jgi:mono/diheme cytochrome c family protein